LSDLGIQSGGLGLEGFLGISSGSGSSGLGFLDLGVKSTGCSGICLGSIPSGLSFGSSDLACAELLNDLLSFLLGIIEFLLVFGLLQSISGLFNFILSFSNFDVNVLFLKLSVGFVLFSLLVGLLSSDFFSFGVLPGLFDVHFFLDERLFQ